MLLQWLQRCQYKLFILAFTSTTLLNITLVHIVHATISLFHENLFSYSAIGLEFLNTLCVYLPAIGWGIYNELASIQFYAFVIILYMSHISLYVLYDVYFIYDNFCLNHYIVSNIRLNIWDYFLSLQCTMYNVVLRKYMI